MKNFVLLTSLLLVSSYCARAQGRGWPKPPEPAERTQPTPRAAASAAGRPRATAARSTRTLWLASTLPADIDRVGHGLLPKDTINKLKRIEKLSQHLRGEINP